MEFELPAIGLNVVVGSISVNVAREARLKLVEALGTLSESIETGGCCSSLEIRSCSCCSYKTLPR